MTYFILQKLMRQQLFLSVLLDLFTVDNFVHNVSIFHILAPSILDIMPCSQKILTFAALDKKILLYPSPSPTHFGAADQMFPTPLSQRQGEGQSRVNTLITLFWLCENKNDIFFIRSKNQVLFIFLLKKYTKVDFFENHLLLKT